MVMAMNFLYNYLFVYIYITILIGLTSSSHYENCVQKTPCLCEFDDGRVINISPIISNNKFLVANQENYTFFYHGCTDSVLKHDIQNINRTTCTHDLTLCLFNATDRSLTNIGLAAASTFELTKNNSLQHDVVYQSNDTLTTIELVCAPYSLETNLMVNNVKKNQYNLSIISPFVCTYNENHGLSTGTKLLIMFFVFLLIYLIGGGCIAYFLRGARGKEIIPNIDFWMSLPGLVRDGLIFVMGGCRSQMVTTADSYDQI